MHIDWAGLGEVFVVAFAAAVGVMVLFAVAVALLSPPEADAPKTSTASGVGRSDKVRVSSLSARNSLVAVLCFLACAAVVVYGLAIIVS